MEAIRARRRSPGHQPADATIDDHQQPQQPAVEGERQHRPSGLEQQITGSVLRSILRDRLSQALGRFPGDYLSGLAGDRIDVDTCYEKSALAAEQHLRPLVDILDLDDRRWVRLESIGYAVHGSDRALRSRISGDGPAHDDDRAVGDNDWRAFARRGRGVDLVRGGGRARDSPQSECEQRVSRYAHANAVRNMCTRGVPPWLARCEERATLQSAYGRPPRSCVVRQAPSYPQLLRPAVPLAR